VRHVLDVELHAPVLRAKKTHRAGVFCSAAVLAQIRTRHVAELRQNP
jgi:hypothetical protein